MPKGLLYKDKHQPSNVRVDDLLSKMTIEEKVAQLCSDLPVNFVENGELNNEAKIKFKDGLGRITQYSTLGLISASSIAKTSNDIQRFFVEETRLGIPVMLQGENLCGYPGAGGTLFPSQINLGSTFKPELAKEMAEVISEETMAVGIKQALSPVIDVSRDPRWGRTYETYGEDPYLITQMGINYIKGMQKNKTQGVLATAKHFLGYSETQGGLNMTATRLCDRELYEVFATPFEAAIKEADLGSVMASYSDIDGIPVAANKKIATGLLRDTMGFEGVLVSDGAAILKIFDYHKIGKTYQESGVLACRAGCDTEMPIGNAYRHLPEYIGKGMLSLERLDEAVKRVLKSKFEYGLFDNPYVDEKKISVSMANDKKWELVEQITEESIILLKNDNKLLPIKKGKKIAVIGPHGGSLREPISGYTYPAYVEMMIAANNEESDMEISFQGMSDEAKKDKASNKDEKPKSPFTVAVFNNEEIESLKDMDSIYKGQYKQKTLVEFLSQESIVSYAKGCDVIDDSTDGFAEAIKVAQESEVVVMTLGGNCGWFGTTGGEGKDRSTLELPGVQQKLLEKIAATGKPIVLVLYGPGIFSINWSLEKVDSIIQAWLPGAKGAEAVGKVIYGDANPGGKLPVSIPRSVGHIPSNYNHRTGSGYGSSKGNLVMGTGYVDSPDTPLLPFGFGLSYTSFELYDFALESKEVDTDGTIVATCKVENTGKFDGDEVIQLYYYFKDAWVTRPIKQLGGFKRISLKAGEIKTLKFNLDAAQTGYYNEEMEFVVEPGRLDIMIGTSAESINFKEEILLVGNKVDLTGKRKYTCDVKVI
ncbi:glycoside hydrolase family 3 N-terminal domain-containing protein [Alkalibacter saccharofermentans]|uniref:Beta-glucosidase n=1 Tax=Alkalibacter saccharofermentans DSM 14828 TaxID=1120975 RepID=A0A1M4U4R5_9FIRM|nr:glycoside hydrolase family 3 N-terminal domain-containing protein [Alkalibacter saccharofermentans]SHE51739.1 beta-glucosidase [Alkalibacter saccharofermentans DSM 14828]